MARKIVAISNGLLLGIAERRRKNWDVRKWVSDKEIEARDIRNSNCEWSCLTVSTTMLKNVALERGQAGNKEVLCYMYILVSIRISMIYK